MLHTPLVRMANRSRLVVALAYVEYLVGTGPNDFAIPLYAHDARVIRIKQRIAAAAHAITNVLSITLKE